MEAYSCQSYTLPVGSATIQVCVARRGNLTALATSGTSDIAMTKALQAECIMPAQANVDGWSPLSGAVQHRLRSEHASSRILSETATRSVSPHSTPCVVFFCTRGVRNQEVGRSIALASRANVAPSWSSTPVGLPPWAKHAPAAEKGREVTLTLSYYSAQSANHLCTGEQPPCPNLC